jgi:microcystin-dependent protein
MARLPRKTQKIFAGSSSANGQFGSARAGTFVLDNDIATLMNLAAWLNGWNSATVSGELLPCLEEMQGVEYVHSSQIAYLLQQGIPEYDSGTTYWQKNIVIKAGTYDAYGSITDNNTGNALTDATKWVSLGTIGDRLPAITAGDAGKVVRVNSGETAYELVNSGFTTGDVCRSYAAAKTGWVLGTGGTIGDASSGSGVRANADTADLFALFWGLDSTIFPILTSAGAGSTRGANAAADFALHKRMTLPDARGRATVGRDDMGGSAASRMTTGGSGVDGTKLGASGGVQTYALVTAELSAHTHTGTASSSTVTGTIQTESTSSTGSLNGIVLATNGAANGTTPITATAAGQAFTTASTGSGTAHQNTQPTIIENVFIKL